MPGDGTKLALIESEGKLRNPLWFAATNKESVMANTGSAPIQNQFNPAITPKAAVALPQPRLS
jgi:hypothetical protein